MSNSFLGGIAAMPYMRIDGDGKASLCGSRCQSCGQVLIGTPRSCSACGARGLETVALPERGRLHTWTIVQRSFPGVRTPFIAAVVDLEGGGALKGTLTGVAPEPELLRSEMSVRVVFLDSGQRDERDRPFIAYGFVPAKEQKS